jgi:hypothetical protein
MEQVCCKTVLELNTKKMGNSPTFPNHTHMTLPAKGFGNYKILMINVAAEFWLFTEQQREGSFVPHIGQNSGCSEYQTVGNSLSFLIVRQTAQNG